MIVTNFILAIRHTSQCLLLPAYNTTILLFIYSIVVFHCMIVILPRRTNITSGNGIHASPVIPENSLKKTEKQRNNPAGTNSCTTHFYEIMSNNQSPLPSVSANHWRHNELQQQVVVFDRISRYGRLYHRSSCWPTTQESTQNAF